MPSLSYMMLCLWKQTYYHMVIFKVNYVCYVHKSKCVFDNLHVLRSFSDLCDSYFNGILPHPVDCNSYIVCTYGQEYVNKCPPDLYFNTKTGICDFKYNVPDCVNIDSSNIHKTSKEHAKRLEVQPDHPRQRPTQTLNSAQEDNNIVHSVHMDLPNPLQVNVLPPSGGIEEPSETQLVGESKYYFILNSFNIYGNI